jgi:hypothetical protein
VSEEKSRIPLLVCDGGRMYNKKSAVAFHYCSRKLSLPNYPSLILFKRLFLVLISISKNRGFFRIVDLTFVAF